VALEDVKIGSGELVYYPGSHRFGDFMYPGDRKHWSSDEDGHDIHNHHLHWLHDQARVRGISLRRFLPRKGDALFWHATSRMAAGRSPGRTRSAAIWSPTTARPAARRFISGTFRPSGKSSRAR
jgi:ectoine hydroxylase-related dioxygenase (phytanoyl-CoA dioxygenase family)